MSNFWTSPTFEPKRAFRFLVEFTPGDGADSLQFLAKSVTRPSYTVSSNPHKFFNHTFHYPGRVERRNVYYHSTNHRKNNYQAVCYSRHWRHSHKRDGRGRRWHSKNRWHLEASERFHHRGKLRRALIRQ